MEIPIKTVVILAWVITIIFYSIRLIAIARKKGTSIITLLRTPSHQSYSAIKAKKAVYNIVIATLLCIAGLLIAYFVQWSS